MRLTCNQNSDWFATQQPKKEKKIIICNKPVSITTRVSRKEGMRQLSQKDETKYTRWHWGIFSISDGKGRKFFCVQKKQISEYWNAPVVFPGALVCGGDSSSSSSIEKFRALERDREKKWETRRNKLFLRIIKFYDIPSGRKCAREAGGEGIMQQFSFHPV